MIHKYSWFDQQLQNVIDKNFPKELFPNDSQSCLQLPSIDDTLNINKANVAFELATPLNQKKYVTASGDTNIKVPQGLLVNPKDDMRVSITAFQVVEEGQKIKNNMSTISKNSFANLLYKALNPPKEYLQLPYTSNEPENNLAYCWSSVYISPTVIPGISTDFGQPYHQKTIEIRYFAPASLIANVGFIEQIYPIYGNPLVKDVLQNEPQKYSGLRNIIILAPHLAKLSKKECGLPHYDSATEIQKRQNQYYNNEDELYNDGKPFKLTWFNSNKHHIISVIADSCFNSSKEEIDSQIAFASNIIGHSLIQHGESSIVSPCYSWDQQFRSTDSRTGLFELVDGAYQAKYKFSEVKKLLRKAAVYQSKDGYLVDKTFPTIIYLPEVVTISLTDRTIKYEHPETNDLMSIPIKNEHYYILPNGYQLQLIRHQVSNQWIIIGTTPNPKYLFKPTLQLLESSQSVEDSITSGLFFVRDWELMQREVDLIVHKNYSNRLKNNVEGRVSRKFLDESRSIGNCIQLLAEDDQNSDEYNAWLKSLNEDSISLAILIKCRFRTCWGDDDSWKQQFSIDKVNGKEGFCLKCNGQEVICNYLQIGQESAKDGYYSRNYRLRQDFYPACKLKMKNGITSSILCSGEKLQEQFKDQQYNKQKSYKLVTNCQNKFFKSNNDAQNHGHDKQCEYELSRLDGKAFLLNYEPVSQEFCKQLLDDVISFDKYTKPMQNAIKKIAEGNYCDYDNFVVSSELRVVDAQNNMKTHHSGYLQTQFDFSETNYMKEKYLLEIRKRLTNKTPFDSSVVIPVDCNIPERLTNTIGVMPTAVYGPIHYQPIPLQILNWIANIYNTHKVSVTQNEQKEMTLNSQINDLPSAYDLNCACLALILGREPVFTSTQGQIGHKLKVDRDMSLIIPEILARMTPTELLPANLISEGCLEAVQDVQSEGRVVKASVLGYRITNKFVTKYFSRIFEFIDGIFTEEHLKPELQSFDSYITGVQHIYENILNAVKYYHENGQYELLIPPLKTLFAIVKDGEHQELNLQSPELLALFKRQNVLSTSWYQSRLIEAQKIEIQTCSNQIQELSDRQLSTAASHKRLEYVTSSQYLDDIQGTIGTNTNMAASELE